MIHITFNTLCPHCNRAMYGKMSVVEWKMTAHGIVHPVGEPLESSPCTIEIVGSSMPGTKSKSNDPPDGAEEIEE